MVSRDFLQARLDFGLEPRCVCALMVFSRTVGGALSPHAVFSATGSAVFAAGVARHGRLLPTLSAAGFCAPLASGLASVSAALGRGGAMGRALVRR